VWDILPLLQQSYDRMPRNLGSLSQWDEEPKKLRQVITGLLSEMDKDPWTNREQFQRHIADQEQLAQLGPQFSQHFLSCKIKRAELELEDLEFLSLYILRSFPAEVLTFTQSWNYWFIDEYQDTSPIQVEILDRLIGTCPHYVVGDPQQSIYFFRGARSKVFHEKQQSFATQGARIEVKSINRRSQTPALSLINDLMDLVNRLQFSPMESLPDKASAVRLAGHFYLVPESLEEHLDTVVKALERLLAQNVSPEAIAILCRENNELRLLLERLEKAGLPAAIASQGHFYDDRFVRDALCFWQFLVNPYNDLNLLELTRSPWFQISDSVLLSLRQGSNQTLWHSLSTLDDKVAEKLRTSLKSIEHIGHLEAWQEGLMSSGLFNEACRVDPTGRKEGNLWKLIIRLHEAERNGVLNYFDPLDLAVETDTNSEVEARAIRQSKQIQLMTIHASKGLEFDHVFLPFLSHSPKKDGADFWSADLDGNHWSISMLDQQSRKAFPSFFSRQNAEDIHNLLAEETERLFYVAITRTKKTLHFFPPNVDHSDFSKGWARHLHPFISRDPGVYRSESGEYEFEIVDGSKLDFQPYQVIERDHHRKSWPPLPFETQRDKDQSISVTSILEEPLVPQQRAKPSIGNLDPLIKGTFFHRKMESFVSRHEPASVPLEILNLFVRNNVPFSEIISGGHPEWSFRIPSSKGFIEGQIDLWGRDSNKQLWIIDYKTGSSRFLEKALLQLQFYAGALQITQYASQTEFIRLVVCYPEEQKIFTKEFSGYEIQEFMSRYEQK
jgi:ATP-dependent helicase/nuclease subunit A